MADRSFTFDWGARSAELRRLHAKLKPEKSFLLTAMPTPVAVGRLTAEQVSIWDTATVAPLPVVAGPGEFIATASVPEVARFVRLDFDARVTIGGKTASCLAFRQLFSVSDAGALLPSSYSFADAAFEAGSGQGAPSPVAVPARPPDRRRMLGLCPLLHVTATGVTVNCEFLDVTELWWAARADKDQRGWYLDPDLHGRPDLLRILAWTSGTAPMLWFVGVSEKARDGGGNANRPGADIVFMRAQAGFNSFFYSSDEKGFLHMRHADTTMFHLARWMLSPLPEAERAKLAKKVKEAAQKAGKPDEVRPKEVEKTGMRLIPKATTPRFDPADPIDLVNDDFRWAFRLSSVEAALGHSPAPDIAFLPLGFDGPESGPFAAGGGYTALFQKDALREVLAGARMLLWIRGAVSRKETVTPAASRELWLLANSGANRLMFRCLQANADDIHRVVSLDGTANDPDAAGRLVPVNVLVKEGVPILKAIAAKRGRAFKLVAVTSPNMWGDSKAKYLAIQKQVLATGVDVTMLPLDAEFDKYWQYPPTATSNPLLFEVLRFWDGHGLATSKRFGSGGRTWLFWHEWVVDGGHLETAPAMRVRTFLEDALAL